MIFTSANMMLARGIPKNFFKDLGHGDLGAWITVGAIVATILGMAIAQKFFGWKPSNRKERRAALERRKKVLWKFERDAAYDEQTSGRDA